MDELHYTRSTRSERLADRFPQLAAAQPDSNYPAIVAGFAELRAMEPTNCDRMPSAAQIMEPIQAICEDYQAGYTAEQSKLREQCDFVDTLTQGTEKDMHFKNTVNFIYSRDFATGYTCGYNDGKTEMIPDRRKTPRTPGRHGMDRLAVSEQHKDALTRVKTW